MLDPKDHPCLFSDPNIHNREARVKLTELMFEKFQVPALYLVKNAVLAR
jgi:actin-related protein